GPARSRASEPAGTPPRERPGEAAARWAALEGVLPAGDRPRSRPGVSPPDPGGGPEEASDRPPAGPASVLAARPPLAPPPAPPPPRAMPSRADPALSRGQTMLRRHDGPTAPGESDAVREDALDPVNPPSIERQLGPAKPDLRKIWELQRLLQNCSASADLSEDV